LLTEARNHNIPVIFSNDEHIENIVEELKLWGNHAIKGTEGCQVIPQLDQSSKDFVVPKRRYSGFFQTDLQLLLIELKIDTLIIAGLHTHMCVRHTTADAYNWGYKIIIPKETTDSFTKDDYEYGLNYLKTVYGATIQGLDEVIKTF
jgi:nicotinamidase-related amidase